MTAKERASVVRVLVDLIKADTVIDEDEIRLYAKLRKDFNIKRDDELAASSMTLADAVNTLSASNASLRKTLLQTFSDMTISDGFCARQEARLIMALRRCLDDDEGGMAEVYSVYEPDVPIESNQVIYVETAWDEAVNSEIVSQYRPLSKEFRLAGFDFVYIPFITNHYKYTSLALMTEIVKFLSPSIAEERVPALVSRLMNVTTAEYSVDQLCNRLGMRNLRDVPPSLLIKIDDTFVGERRYANFLRLTIDEDILTMSQKFIDEYCALLSSDVQIVPSSEEMHGQFLYKGFYKQLLDIYVIRSGVSSRVLVDFVKEKIIFPDLDIEIKGMHRRDKALYVLMLMETARGGLNFNIPSTARQKAAYDARMSVIDRKYKLVYQRFNGDRDTAPCLENSAIRRPVISNIRRCIARLDALLHNTDDYNVTRDSFGHYRVDLDPDMVWIKDYGQDNAIPLTQSQIYHDIMLVDCKA